MSQGIQTMLPTYNELLAYEAWADVQLLRAVDAHEAAWADDQLRDRLHHSHVVQRVFLQLLEGRAPNLEELQVPFGSFEEFRASVSKYAREVSAFLATQTEQDLERLLSVPWFGDKQFTAAQVLLQIVMHSQHHRGQNAARLKQLGETPPTFDFIVWLSRGKPDANS